MIGCKENTTVLKKNIICLEVVCPFCRAKLSQNDKEARCSKCQKVFPKKENILCFGNKDDFYEGKFTTTKFRTIKGIKKILKTVYRKISIDTFEERFLSKQIKKIASNCNIDILDFGCGGGAVFLTDYGRVTGVDLSVSSLTKAKQIYDQVYQIDGKRLPFFDNTFDCVYTSHVFGHVPLSEKSFVISETYRVLKTGGYLVSSIECDSESLIYKRAKRHSQLFSKCYVEQWGHYGLELPIDNFNRFRSAGFLPVIELADIHKGYLRPVTSYVNLLSYEEVDAILSNLGKISKWIEKSRIITRSINLIFGMMIPISYIFTPPNHRDSAKIVYKKPDWQTTNL